MYAPYYQDGEGSWIIAGDLGIVLEIRTCSQSSYQVVKVKWMEDGVDMVDMSSEVLLKITPDKSNPNVMTEQEKLARRKEAFVQDYVLRLAESRPDSMKNSNFVPIDSYRFCEVKC